MKKTEKERKRAETSAGNQSGTARGALDFVLSTGVCIGAGAVLGAANWFYRQALVPGKKEPGGKRRPLNDEYEEGSRWAETHPAREDVYLHADDGLQLHACLIGAEPPEDPGKEHREEHRFAVCVHGYAADGGSMGLFARVYRERFGMHVLLPDLRGHGRSDGNYIGMGYDDSRDLLRWIDWILERDPSAQIILHGVSMGAAAVLMATGCVLPKQVAAAVADSSYTSAMEEFRAVYRRGKRPPVTAAPVLEAVRAIALVRAGYDIAKASPVRAVTRSKTPTLFIHGQADNFVPAEMMPALYRAASCPKAFLWIPEASHMKAVLVDPETYWARVERFLHANGVSLF